MIIKHNHRVLANLLKQFEIAKTAEQSIDKGSRIMEDCHVYKMEKFNRRFLGTTCIRCRDWANAVWMVIIGGWKST